MLTPLDIHNKEFTRGIRGFNVDDVNQFLDQVIKDYELTIREKNELEEQVEDLTEKVNQFKSIEDTLNKSIVIAQETAEELKDHAKKESKLIIKEAEKNADRILEEALSESRRISVEIEGLKRQSKVFRTRLRMLVEAQLEMIDNSEWEDFLQLVEEDTEVPVD